MSLVQTLGSDPTIERALQRRPPLPFLWTVNLLRLAQAAAQFDRGEELPDFAEFPEVAQQWLAWPSHTPVNVDP